MIQTENPSKSNDNQHSDDRHGFFSRVNAPALLIAHECERDKLRHSVYRCINDLLNLVIEVKMKRKLSKYFFFIGFMMQTILLISTISNGNIAGQTKKIPL